MKLFSGYYSQFSYTFANRPARGMHFYKVTGTLNVYDATSKESLPVDYLGEDIADSAMTSSRYSLGGGLGFGLLGVWLVAVILIWTMCIDWCRCGK